MVEEITIELLMNDLILHKYSGNTPKNIQKIKELYQ